jgi:hypothetical protein
MERAPLIGFVRETNHGRILDVRGSTEPNNLSGTSPGLPVHRHRADVLSRETR